MIKSATAEWLVDRIYIVLAPKTQRNRIEFCCAKSILKKTVFRGASNLEFRAILAELAHTTSRIEVTNRMLWLKDKGVDTVQKQQQSA